MKQLILIRHAKSSWDDPSLPDLERPLNERGKKDVPVMAKRLSEKIKRIDCFVSSPAKRAMQTCKRLTKALGFKKKKIVEEPALYEAGEENFYKVVEKFKNKWDSVAIISHNPGLTSFANSLTGTKVDDMPTCSVMAIKLEIDNWVDFRAAKKEFWFFDYPGAQDS